MDRTIKLWLNILLFIFLVLILSFTIAFNSENRDALLALSSVLIASVSIRYLFLYESEKFYNWGIAGILTDAAIVYIISGMDKYGICRIFYLVLIGDSIIFYPIIFSIIISVVCFMIFLIISYISKKSSSILEFSPYLITSILSIIFICMIMSIVKYVISQHSRLDKTMKELEVTYGKLKETSQQLEQMVLLKERNRIAGEVHDTIGHTLTTVLVEIEAGKRIMAKEPDKAIRKLELAQEEIRKGLGDISKSIKTINDGPLLLEDFRTSLEKIIKETEIHTAIQINSQFINLQNIPGAVREVLLKALKEGLTNGIRHGNSTQFEFELSYEDDSVRFRLKDNGRGCENLEFGFGLTAMKSRLDKFGGNIDLTSETGKGCTLLINIPCRKEENNG